MTERFEVGWEGVVSLLAAFGGAVALTWGGIKANEARIEGMQARIERIDENVQWLVLREVEQPDE